MREDIMINKMAEEKKNFLYTHGKESAHSPGYRCAVSSLSPIQKRARDDESKNHPAKFKNSFSPIESMTTNNHEWNKK